MDINKKIEEIRQKPQHVREKYVWTWVGVCMLIVVIIWLLSVKFSFQFIPETEEPKKLPELKQQMQELKNSTPSIQNFKDQVPQVNEDAEVEQQR